MSAERTQARRESLIQGFRSAAERWPESVAIAAAGRELTYGELRRRADRASAALAASGFTPGSLLPIVASDISEVVVAMLGALGVRGAFVPITPDLPAARLSRLLAEVASPWAYVEPRFAPLLAEHWPRSVPPPDTSWSSAGYGLPVPSVDPEPDDLCYVVFTSGSTGEPKGIAGRLKGVEHFVRWEIELLGAGPGTRVSQLTSPSFDAALRDLFVPLTCGGTVCVPEDRKQAADGRWLARWLEEQEVSVLHSVPSLFRGLLNEGLRASSLPALRHVLLAGERLLPADAERWLATFGERIQLVNLYGPSETTMTKFFHVVRPSDAELGSIPIGKPMKGAAAILIDEKGNACPAGMPGEILIRTPFRSLGYFRRPDLTRQAFIPNPFGDDPEDLVYRTGDLGRVLRSGELEFLGRRDHQVKIRGARVELGEIEDLLRRHPAVADQVVVASEEPEGGISLLAYVVLSRPVAAGELRVHCLAALPDYMVPSAFVVLAALPRTFSGKVDRGALPKPDGTTEGGDGDDSYLQGPAEELIAATWGEVLGLQRIGRKEDFFALGGHSLLAGRVLNRLQAAFGVELSLRSFVEAPTIAGLAAAVQACRVAGGPGGPPLERCEGEPTRLSFAQERLWFLAQLAPESATYNLPSHVLLEGPLDLAALAATLAEVVRRHDVLRSRFPASDGSPRVEVQTAEHHPLPLVDLGGLAAAAREREIPRLAAAEAQRPFRLDGGALFRVTVVRLSPRRHALLATMHHIVGDAWSTAVLVREVSALYPAFECRAASPLPELPLRYRDWAAWQRRWLESEVAAASLEHWRQRLANLPALLSLPTDRPRPPVQSYRGGRVPIQWPNGLSSALASLARREGATLFMVLLAGFMALLHRWTGEVDLAVGAPTAGRRHVETEGLIGLFVNTLVMRGDLRGDPTVSELLGRVRALVLDADANQTIPFERIVEAVQPQRSLAHSPLFQVMLVLQNAPREALELPGLRLRLLPGSTRGAKVDWTLSLAEGRDGLGGAFEHSSDLFDRVTAKRALCGLERLLGDLAADPARRISELALVSEAERHQALAEWNDTWRLDADRGLLHETIARQARRDPERIAVDTEGSHLSFGDLDRLANRLAHRLRRSGVGPGSLVAVFMERSAAMVVSLLAVLKAGGAYLPLDPAYPAERLAFMLEDSRVEMLLTQQRLVERLGRTGAEVLAVDAEEAGLAAESPEAPEVALTDQDLAYVIYTSGSTGRPKAAMNTHGAIRNRLHWMQETFGLTADDRVLQKTPFSFDVSVWEFFWPLMTGARLVIARPGGHQDTGYLVARIVAAGVTTLHFVPSMLQAFLDEPALESCTSLRRVISSGEALPNATAQGLLSRLDIGLYNLYGPTEAAVDVTSRACLRGEVRPSVPLGRPIANTWLYVLDPRCEPVPIGVAGELYIGGEAVGRGYQRRPDLTAERFLPDPWSGAAGARLYRTGDLARLLSGGEIDYLGRLDHQVKIRGFRVELGEIEAALREHPGVHESAVLMREDAPGDRRLVAYLGLGESPAPPLTELRALLVRRLPEYMIPMSFVMMHALPLSPNGKLDIRALPPPEAVPRSAGAPPETPTEQEVAGIWAEVLRLETIGRDDDFFALGGHSLLATQVLARLRSRLGVGLSFGEFFQGPTVRVLAERIEEALLAQLGDDRVDEMLSLLEGLDDEQAAALLTTNDDVIKSVVIEE